MHQTKKGNQHYFGMKAHIGVDDDAQRDRHRSQRGRRHTGRLTVARRRVVCLCRCGLIPVWQSVPSMQTARSSGRLRRAASATGISRWAARLAAATRLIEKAKAQTRAKVEHRFRVTKCQFGYTKVRFRGLAMNVAELVTLFALSNLWLVRKRLLMAGEVRP